METIAKRDSDGIVTANTGRGQITAKIPSDRSMLGIMGLNGITADGVYKNDGWVYVNDIPVRKWHIYIDTYRVWEPKLKDLPSLYKLWKEVKKSNSDQWNRIDVILQDLWKLRNKNSNNVIAHARPTHTYEWYKSTEPWWRYTIHQWTAGEGLSFSFDWLDKKPKKLINHELGERLYKEERRWWNSTCKRSSKVNAVFINAMKRSLPKADPKNPGLLSLQFGDDHFYFMTQFHRGYAVWEMMDIGYKFENRIIM